MSRDDTDRARTRLRVWLGGFFVARRGMSALLLGSETVKVLTHSTIPVLVYR